MIDEKILTPSVDYFPRFDFYASADMYEAVHIKGYTPMTAKEIDTEEKQDELLNDLHYYIEEKFDGTRALLYFLSVNPLNSKDYLPVDYDFCTVLATLGSGYEGGRSRIYNIVTHLEGNEASEALKKEYGVGGCTFCFPRERKGFVDYSPKGMKITVRDEYEKTYSWSMVAKTYRELICAGQFYPQKAFTRCFSRRISEKTGFYCENTDSLPQLRDLNVPELTGTIIDGEMYIPNRPFKDVSSTLNCKWDKAVDRQNELGFIVFHAFDILFYKGIDLRNMPLCRRKVYLQLVVDKLSSPYVKAVTYNKCGEQIDTTPYHYEHGSVQDVAIALESGNSFDSYPHFKKEFYEDEERESLSPRAFYEYIVASGGEGVMVKPSDGRYHHKRGREYQKIKKFLTREVIITGFTPPTKEYTGKFPNDRWEYWCDRFGIRLDVNKLKDISAKHLNSTSRIPVSKYWFEDWIGTIRFGVVISPEEMHKLPKNKKFNVEEMIIEGYNVLVLEVGECSGFDEEERKMFSANPKEYIGSVIEVKANEIFRDTGKMRHPRFMRLREDKNAIECTFLNHIS